MMGIVPPGMHRFYLKIKEVFLFRLLLQAGKLFQNWFDSILGKLMFIAEQLEDSSCVSLGPL